MNAAAGAAAFVPAQQFSYLPWDSAVAGNAEHAHFQSAAPPYGAIQTATAEWLFDPRSSLYYHTGWGAYYDATSGQYVSPPSPWHGSSHSSQCSDLARNVAQISTQQQVIPPA